ncbi:MAG: 4a-hydroxytetrahydrobiopterin dehydratase [Gammaproteobacteria bacterium]|nr:MAG: 4a-hydroxytetrahydrobiopterin dehydratase [Gammaproteobacteria bacterium]
MKILMELAMNKHCVPCEGGIPPLDKEHITSFLKQLTADWQVSGDNKQIFKDFHFKNFYETMAFVNAIAWMAHQENHHPDLEVGYNHCLVRYHTHAINGLSENDFICAKKIDEI